MLQQLLASSNAVTRMRALSLVISMGACSPDHASQLSNFGMPAFATATLLELLGSSGHCSPAFCCLLHTVINAWQPTALEYAEGCAVLCSQYKSCRHAHVEVAHERGWSVSSISWGPTSMADSQRMPLADLLAPLSRELASPPADLLGCMAAIQLVQEVAVHARATAGAVLAGAVLEPLVQLSQPSDPLLCCQALPVVPHKSIAHFQPTG